MMDDLQNPYHDQLKAKNQALKSQIETFKAEEGTSDFNRNIRPTATFSSADYFKTVHLGGDDVIKQEEEDRKRELEQWKQKVVVDKEHFYVNTRVVEKIHQFDKYKGLLEDLPKKVGFRLGNSRVKEIAKRSIGITKHVESAPPSMLTAISYKDPRPNLIKEERMKTEFNTNIKNDSISKTFLSKKVFVEPMQHVEKAGPKWG